MHARRVLLVTWIGGCTPVGPEVAPTPAPTPVPTLPAPARAIELERPSKPRSAWEDPDRMGVAPCDEYRERYGRCVEHKLPRAAREQLRDALDATWHAWAEAASGPARGELPAACRAALDAARRATHSFGCEWPDPPHAYGPIGIEPCDAFVRDYGRCITTRVPARRRAAMLAKLAAQVVEWQDAKARSILDEDAPLCAEARAAARRATARYGCEL